MADKAMSNVFTTFGKSGSSSSGSNSSASSGNSRSKGTGRASSREEEEAAADIATFKRMQSRTVDDASSLGVSQTQATSAQMEGISSSGPAGFSSAGLSSVGLSSMESLGMRGIAGGSSSARYGASSSEANDRSFDVESSHGQGSPISAAGAAAFKRMQSRVADDLPVTPSAGAQGTIDRSQSNSISEGAGYKQGAQDVTSSSSAQGSVGSGTSKGVSSPGTTSSANGLAASGAKSGLWGDTGHGSTHSKGETRSSSSESQTSPSYGESVLDKGAAFSEPMFSEPKGGDLLGAFGSSSYLSSPESLVIPDYESSLKQAILNSQGASASTADILAAGGSSTTEVPPVPNVTSYSQTSVSEDGVTQTKTYERQIGEDGVAQDFVRESARTVEEGPNGETIVKEFSSVTDSAGTMATATMSVTDSEGNVTSSSLTAPVATHSYGISEVGPEASHSLTSSVPVDTVLSLNVPLDNGPSFVTDANSNISGQLNEALNANLSADDLRDTMQNIVTQALSNYPEHTNVGVMVTLPPEVLNDAEKVGAVAEGIELGGGVPVYVQEASLTGYNLVGAPTANFSSMDFGHEASLILSKEAEAAGHDIPRGVTRQVGDLINSGVVDDHKVIIINEDGSIQASDPQSLAQGEADKHLTVGQIKEMAQDMASLTPQHVANLDFMFASQEASHSLSDYASLAGASQLKDIAENGHDLEESLAGLKKAVAEAGAEAGLDVKIDGYEAAKIMQAGSDLARENVEVLDVAKVVVAENGEISISASEAEIPEKAVAIPLDQALEAAGISREELGNREQDQANVQALVQEEKTQEAEAAAELAMME